jgi:hypothetical protein
MEIIDGERTSRWKTHLVALGITLAIFGTAFYISDYFTEQRLAAIRTTQDNISVDILSLETQFDLLAEHSCKDIAENSVLSQEIHPLANRLAYMEAQRGVDEEELLRLKRFYSLLQIKDLLLMQKVSAKCGLNPIVILYFYSNRGDCEECTRQGYILTGLAEDVPEVRIYSFDRHLNLSALKTLLSIHDIEETDATAPTLVIGGETYPGPLDREALEKLIPEIKALRAAREATTTQEVTP